MISFIIPTHNRTEALVHTLRRLAAIDPNTLADDPELIIVDNASQIPPDLPVSLPNGVRVRRIRLNQNIGAAARNVAANEATGRWLVMLDDDSSPESGDLAAALDAAPDEIAAIGFETILPNGDHEAGGLPEVVIGCACAIRRDTFLSVGAYDPAFDYYVEEYDLCARLIADGYRIAHTRAVLFEHRKVESGRSFERIISRLVRNNGWVIQRYAPESEREQALERMMRRYREIAHREYVESGFRDGESQLRTSLDAQPRTPLTQRQWDRFTGRSAAQRTLSRELAPAGACECRLVERGKGDDIIEEILEDLGASVVDDARAPSVIATLSPGPLLDAMERHPCAIAPWRPMGSAAAFAEATMTGSHSH